MELAAIRTIGDQFHTRIKAWRRLSASRSSYNSQPQPQPQPRTTEDHMVMIKLNFSYKKITRYRLLQEDVDSPPEIIEEEDPSSARFGTLGLSRQQLFNDSKSARQAIKNELQNWPVLAPHNCNDLSEKVMRKATVKAQSSRRYDVLDMYVVFTEVYYRTLRVVNYEEEEEVEDEDDSMCMVPVDPSIQSLKRKRTDDCDQRNESCSICLDDLSYSRGSDQDRALRCMPCSHVFHADCIRKWLKISHSCPLCRYEMPTN